MKHLLETFGFDIVESEHPNFQNLLMICAHGDIPKVRNANHIKSKSCSKTVGTGVGSAVGAAVGIGVGAAVGTFETLPSSPLDEFIGSQIQTISTMPC